MPLRQPSAVRTDDERHMNELRRPQAQRLIKQQLPWCGRDQIVAAHHLRDALRRVIHDHGKLVGRHAG